MIAFLIVNLCVWLWFFARLGSERRKRVALENALIGGFAEQRKREGHISDRVVWLEMACAAKDLQEIEGFARWAREQLRGQSGAGESHWKQFSEYRLGSAALDRRS